MPNPGTVFNQTTNKRSFDFLSLAIPLLIALWFTILFFGEYINPKNFTELPQSIRENHITSLIFRADTWHYPISLTKKIGSGIPIGLTDAIPLVAIMFKIFNINNLQYFGLWILISNILVAFFGYRIGKIISQNSLIAGLISLICLTFPFLWYHSSYTPWIAGQWLILWAYSIFFTDNLYPSLEWYGLLIIASLIHPYFMFVCFYIMFSDILKLYLYKHSISSVKSASIVSNCMSIIFLVSGISGVFYLETFVNVSATFTSINFINETSNTYNSSYFALGIGSYIGLLISFGAIFYFRNDLKKFKIFLTLIPTYILFILISLMSGFKIGSHILHLSLGDLIQSYMISIFTSGPKFLLPILWMTPLFLLYTTMVFNKKKEFSGTIFLIVITFIQVIQFNPIVNQEKNKFTPLDEQTKQFIRGSGSFTWIFDKELPLIPPCYEKLAYFAFNNDIHINTAPIIRFPTQYQVDIMTATQNFLEKKFIDNTIYVLSKEFLPKEYENLGRTVNLADNIMLFKPYEIK